jgi:hypothetical protein
VQTESHDHYGDHSHYDQREMPSIAVPLRALITLLIAHQAGLPRQSVTGLPSFQFGRTSTRLPPHFTRDLNQGTGVRPDSSKHRSGLDAGTHHSWLGMWV